jgi:hypothetical protein
MNQGEVRKGNVWGGHEGDHGCRKMFCDGQGFSNII